MQCSVSSGPQTTRGHDVGPGHSSIGGCKCPSPYLCTVHQNLHSAYCHPQRSRVQPEGMGEARGHGCSHIEFTQRVGYPCVHTSGDPIGSRAQTSEHRQFMTSTEVLFWFGKRHAYKERLS